MFKPALLLSIAMATTALAQTPVKSPWTVRGNLPEKDFIIQSHRGAGDLAPENTLEAFELGWEMNTYPEADLRTTKDGVIVTFHDKDFSRVVRTSDEALKKKTPADVTWEELSKLDVGSYLGEQFGTHRVITIAEAFQAVAKDPTRHLYLDIKSVDFDNLAKEVRAAKVEKQVILASTKYPEHRRWKKLIPGSDSLLWMGGTEEQLKKRFEDLRKTDFADITQLQIHVRWKENADLSKPDPFNISDAFLIAAGEELRAHKITFQSLPWGATDPKVYHKLLDLGVMSFASDRPAITQKAVHDYYTLTP